MVSISIQLFKILGMQAQGAGFKLQEYGRVGLEGLFVIKFPGSRFVEN